jgi:hypothetical protein
MQPKGGSRRGVRPGACAPRRRKSRHPRPKKVSRAGGGAFSVTESAHPRNLRAFSREHLTYPQSHVMLILQ